MTVTADRFRTVRGDTLADIQAAIDEQQYVNLEAGTLYEGDTTITLSGGGGPHNQKQYIDARGATINYTGDGKRAVEFLPQGKLDDIPGPERSHSNRVAHSQHWFGGTIYGPGRDVEDSAAIYAEDTFGCHVYPQSVGYAEHGIWFRNKHYWSEANDIAITGMAGNRSDGYSPEGKQGGIGWSVRLDGGPANDDLNGTLSYRTTDVTIDWAGGDLGYLWLNGASMHGGTIDIRGFLGETATGLKVSGGGWNQAATAHLEFEGGGEEAHPVYIGPNANSPLFVGPRIGHPSNGEPDGETIVNDSDGPALCLMHHGLYNNYTEKLIGFGDNSPSFGDAIDAPGLKLTPQDLHQAHGGEGELRRHDGTGDAPAGIYAYDPAGAAWGALTTDATIDPVVEPEIEEAAATISMQDGRFDPHTVSVQSGETVAWVNDDDVEHDVTTNLTNLQEFHAEEGAELGWTANATAWNFEKTVPPGGRVTNTFPNAGVYEFYCSIHGEDEMCGAVSVGGVEIDGSLPCE
jgi:plastocyanin